MSSTDENESSLDLNKEEYRKIKSFLNDNPDHLIGVAHLVKDSEQKTELLKSAVDSGVNIYALLKMDQSINIRMIHDISDFLLNHPRNPISMQKLLDIVLMKPTLGHIDSPELVLKQKLVDKCLEGGAQIENSLTVYHYPGHAFIRLTCEDCDHGKAYDLSVGMYGTGPEKVGPEMIDYIDMAGSFFGVKDFLGNRLLKDPNKPRYYLDQEFRGGTPLDSDTLRKEHKLTPRGLEELKSKKFPISKEKAQHVYNELDKYIEGVPDFRYRVLGNNCIDFAQKFYKEAGLPGNHVNQMYDSYPHNKIGIYALVTDTYKTVAAPYYLGKSLYNNDGSYRVEDNPAAATAAAILVGGRVLYNAAKKVDELLQGKSPPKSKGTVRKKQHVH